MNTSAPGGTSRHSSMAGGHIRSTAEMVPIAYNTETAAGNHGNRILNECRDIRTGMDQIDGDLKQLHQLHQRILQEADSTSSTTSKIQLDALRDKIFAQCAKLAGRIRTLSPDPGAQKIQHVGVLCNRLQGIVQRYQQLESSFDKRIQDQSARTNGPDAPHQVFGQANVQSNRQRSAHNAHYEVQKRHKALCKVEQQVTELFRLFQTMAFTVDHHDDAVTEIAQRGQDAAHNIDKGCEEIAVAVGSARKMRRKKWICLGICIIVVVLIAVIVLVYIMVNRATKAKGNLA